MPRGVYDRKAKKAEGGGEKPKRKYTRRAKSDEKPDVQAFALEAFTGAAENLAKTVRDTVDMDEAPELASALRTFELCSKIFGALK
jgi:hypothetical protein